jgi:hypothetical protein
MPSEPPDWIDALSAALPGTDRRAIEGWAVWFKTLWSDSDRALELLRLASQPDGLAAGPRALVRHLELMGRHVSEVESHLRRLSEEITGLPQQHGEGGGLNTAELKSALCDVIGAIDDLGASDDADARQQLGDQLDEAIRVATALRASLDDA